MAAVTELARGSVKILSPLRLDSSDYITAPLRSVYLLVILSGVMDIPSCMNEFQV